jgi:hypothetical protein
MFKESGIRTFIGRLREHELIYTAFLTKGSGRVQRSTQIVHKIVHGIGIHVTNYSWRDNCSLCNFVFTPCWNYKARSQLTKGGRNHGHGQYCYSCAHYIRNPICLQCCPKLAAVVTTCMRNTVYTPIEPHQSKFRGVHHRVEKVQ